LTTLVLVRHGQASFASSNYDQLSETGVRQSLILGEHWHRLGQRFDAVHSGEMQRQHDTAQHALGAMGIGTTPVSRSAAFNEYDHQTLIRAYTPVIAREHPEFSMDRKALLGDRKQFQRFFEKVIHYWLEGRDGDLPVAESWEAFRQRCLDGLCQAAPADADTVVVVTSGGVITAALQEALKLDAATAFNANWHIYNASVHRFRLGRRGLTLTGFNDVAHLELVNDPELLTFR
jgi:broad specificity phosphatase PhoE